MLKFLPEGLPLGSGDPGHGSGGDAFLPWLVKNECPPDVNLYVLFAIYLSESVLDYLMFAYNNATFTAFSATT